MKIRINEKESYNITLPEVLSSDEFISILNRLNIIRKLFPVSNIMSEDVTTRKDQDGILTIIKKNGGRELALEIVKLYYSDRKKCYQKLEELGRTIDKGDMKSVKAKYTIQPNEVNLVRYPDKSESRNWVLIKSLRINEN